MYVCVQISQDTFRLLRPEKQAEWQPRGSIEVKGRGTMVTYLYSPGTATSGQGSGCSDKLLPAPASTVQQEGTGL